MTTEEIKKVCEELELKNYTINDDMSIDVDGDVNLNWTTFPVPMDAIRMSTFPVRFGHVSGGFACSTNVLTSLVGAPHTVGGYFICDSNKLTNLEGSPHTVGGGFSCSFNKLTSLKGSPVTVGGYFYCQANKLSNLIGGPINVGGNWCHSNKRLTSLEGFPRNIGGEIRENNDLVKRFIRERAIKELLN